MRQFLIAVVLVMAAFFSDAGTSTASACPMCKTANENADDPRPRAYMYSILFMLAMPATIFTGFGIGFYRLAKQAEADAAVELDGVDE